MLSSHKCVYGYKPVPQSRKEPKWRVLAQVNENIYILCSTSDGYVSYAPMYIHSFRLIAPHRLLEAQLFNQQYQNYEDIQNVPDRLRWGHHFCGRDPELEKLHEFLGSKEKVFVQGIAGIGKSELAKAYAKKYDKEYTNIMYITYSGDLKNDIVNLDFADDLDKNETVDARFNRHHRHFRKLRADSLLITDNFNTVTSKYSILDVILKYHCRILFTTRSIFDNYTSMNLEEIVDTEVLVNLMGCFYSEAEKNHPVLEQIIQTVHSHSRFL